MIRSGQKAVSKRPEVFNKWPGNGQLVTESGQQLTASGRNRSISGRKWSVSDRKWSVSEGGGE